MAVKMKVSSGGLKQVNEGGRAENYQLNVQEAQEVGKCQVQGHRSDDEVMERSVAGPGD